jgi:alpha-glucoside transport system substrate-binding protein
MNSSRVGRLFPLAVLFTVLAAACGPASSSSSGGGKTLDVIATWSGDEQKSFLAMVKPWEDRTGNKIAYESSRDVNALLTTRIQAGNPPDLAGLPGPGQMAQFAKQGKLVSLDNAVDMSTLQSQYGSDWIKLGTVNGHLVGIFIKAAIKGLIYYDPKNVSSAGVDFSTPPKTWDELVGDYQTIRQKTGQTPWCIGIESGAATGWPATDWIKDFFLRQAGPTKYEAWGASQEPWNSPEMKTAWQTFGSVVNSPSLTYGGKNYVLSTNFATAFDPMFQSPPKCYLHHQASFITSFFTHDFPNLQPNTDFNFFGFPDINPQYHGPQVVAGDLFGMFKDSPQARDLIKYLTTPEAQKIWVKRGGAISPNKQVTLDNYTDQQTKAAAQLLLAANPPEFDAGDLQDNALQTAFFQGVTQYIQNPGNLDAILNHLEQLRTSGA